MYVQELIFTLQRFWADRGCVVEQPVDVEVGAGTFHPATFLKVLGPEPWNAAFAQFCRRPSDGRYGENPMRGGAYYQFQVGMKPSPPNIQDLDLDSLRTIGLDPDRTAQAIASYPGLAHRQERVATVDGVLFVNDSKATNGDATSKALACYDTIYWIAGGLAKDGGIEGLASFWPRIRHAYLIGKAADSFAATLNGQVPTTMSGTLEAAVEAAFAQAWADQARGAVVLLSPACASFDQFANFEARGEAFKTLARTIVRKAQKEGVSA